jgi:mono/diheme cytochrome c family protein
MIRFKSLAPFALVWTILPGALAITPQETEFFEKQVRPVLAEQCYKCHGADKQKGALRVDSRAAILKGTDEGPVVVPGHPEQSEFIKSIKHVGDSKMPEKADKLPDSQIAALEQWVKMGMPWPDNEGPVKPAASLDVAKTHWSLQPIKEVAPPVVKDPQHWAQSPVDQFILAKLEEKNLKPSPRAGKRTLLRRATFDLLGLPPTEAEVEAFEKDNSPEAFAKVVDRLLASPHYGERWGRYWLDVARYADTKGYLAGGEERRYPFSWTYRDWVIGAFNSDLPYDQFVIDQIAGDRVATKDDPRPMAALGFLTLGRRFLNSQADIIDDRIDVVCRGLMGLTVGCARCHDHKFDPILQKDYYALYGVFASSIEPAAKDLPVLPANRDAATEAEYQKQVGVLEGNIAKFLDERRALYALRTLPFLGVPAVIPPDVAERLLDKQAHLELTKLKNKVDELNAGPLAPPRPQAMVDAPQPMNPHVFIRGNPGRPGEAVPRRFIQVLSGGNPKPFTDGSGRLELAKSIADKHNPLTARVFVNRVWNLHFGAGFVRTPGDFGTKGEPPTHPELLDYLAAHFMADGWSVKKLQRAIMLSSVYQQTSDLRTDAAQVDPENRLLWHMNRRRLDFEAMRDSLLAVAGQLDGTIGGRPVDLTTAPYAKRPRRSAESSGRFPHLRFRHTGFHEPTAPRHDRAATGPLPDEQSVRDRAGAGDGNEAGISRTTGLRGASPRIVRTGVCPQSRAVRSRCRPALRHECHHQPGTTRGLGVSLAIRLGRLQRNIAQGGFSQAALLHRASLAGWSENTRRDLRLPHAQCRGRPCGERSFPRYHSPLGGPGGRRRLDLGTGAAAQ